MHLHDGAALHKVKAVLFHGERHGGHKEYHHSVRKRTWLGVGVGSGSGLGLGLGLELGLGQGVGIRCPMRTSARGISRWPLGAFSDAPAVSARVKGER